MGYACISYVVCDVPFVALAHILSTGNVFARMAGLKRRETSLFNSPGAS
jgi:hypothetical protein